MIQVLRLLWFYYSYHWIVMVGTSIGLALLSTGLVMALLGILPTVWQFAMFVLCLPLMTIPGAFRQLVANRRLTMVPNYRVCALIALLVVPIVGGLLGFWYAALRTESPEWYDAINHGLMLFGLISLWVLVSQWLGTYRAGWPAQLILLFLILRLFLAEDDALRTVLMNGLVVAPVAVVGWIWLYRFISRRPVIAAPAPANSMDSSWRINYSVWQPMLWPGSARVSRPVGTLLRGTGDSLDARLGGIVVPIVILPLLYVLWVTTSPHAFTDTDDQHRAVQLFLTGSTVFGAVLRSTTMTGWPARLRALWLRLPGNRHDLWRRVEREVIAESGLVLAVAGVLAVLIWLVFDIGWLVLLGYCAACTAMSVFSAYLVLWLRAEGSGLQAVTWIIMVVLMIGMALLTYSSRIGLIEPSAWLAAAIMLCMVAVLFRQLARSAYLTIDWCVVRPETTHSLT